MPRSPLHLRALSKTTCGVNVSLRCCTRPRDMWSWSGTLMPVSKTAAGTCCTGDWYWRPADVIRRAKSASSPYTVSFCFRRTFWMRVCVVSQHEVNALREASSHSLDQASLASCAWAVDVPCCSLPRCFLLRLEGVPPVHGRFQTEPCVSVDGAGNKKTPCATDSGPVMSSPMCCCGAMAEPAVPSTSPRSSRRRRLPPRGMAAEVDSSIGVTCQRVHVKPEYLPWRCLLLLLLRCVFLPLWQHPWRNKSRIARSVCLGVRKRFVLTFPPCRRPPLPQPMAIRSLRPVRLPTRQNLAWKCVTRLFFKAVARWARLPMPRQRCSPPAAATAALTSPCTTAATCPRVAQQAIAA
eukprot:m.482798 g.482798  ORF g.482798 m.482798 type:complete len:352 (-) comp22669_c0_seq1:1632-2687(-)